MKKEDFVEWRMHPITQALYDDVAEAVSAIMNAVLTRIEANAGLDTYQKGYIAGVKSVMDWDPDLEEETDA